MSAVREVKYLEIEFQELLHRYLLKQINNLKVVKIEMIVDDIAMEHGVEADFLDGEIASLIEKLTSDIEMTHEQWLIMGDTYVRMVTNGAGTQYVDYLLVGRLASMLNDSDTPKCLMVEVV